MRDIYLYEDCNVLKNKLDIKTQTELDEAEAHYTALTLRELYENPIRGNYDYNHYLQIHYHIFHDLYDWAGQQRKMNIEKYEPVLGGLSIEYADMLNIAKDCSNILNDMNSYDWNTMNFNETVEAFSESLADFWKVHAFREGNTRTTITFCCQFADEFIGPIDKDIFKDNAEYTRRALVAYNAYFSDGQDFSKKEYLERIVADAFRNLKPIKKKKN